MNADKIFYFISKNDISSISLVISNLIPLFGVLFWGWSIYNIMILFWAESAIIGFYNIKKMQKIGGIKSEPFILFFLLHYGLFMAVHLNFINGIFGEQSFFSLIGSGNMNFGGRGYAETEDIDSKVADSITTIFPALVSLLISHGISYYKNFIGKKEYLDASNNIEKQMMNPYGRIVIMQLTLIIGGFFVMIFKFKSVAIALLVILKTIADLKSHAKYHSVVSEPVGEIEQLKLN